MILYIVNKKTKKLSLFISALPDKLHSTKPNMATTTLRQQAALAGFNLVPKRAGGRRGISVFGDFAKPQTQIQKQRAIASAGIAREARETYIDALIAQGVSPADASLRWKATAQQRRLASLQANNTPQKVVGRMISAAVSQGFITTAQGRNILATAQEDPDAAKQQLRVAKGGRTKQWVMVNGKIVRNAAGIRQRNPDFPAQATRVRATAYNMKILTGKNHTRKVAQLLNFLGPGSIAKFVEYDAEYYPGKKTITQAELADFTEWALQPWASKAPPGTQARWAGRDLTPSARAPRDIQRLKEALSGTGFGYIGGTGTVPYNTP
jgi:hypothetical protein